MWGGRALKCCGLVYTWTAHDRLKGRGQNVPGVSLYKL